MRGIISRRPVVSFPKQKVHQYVAETSCSRVIEYPSTNPHAKRIVLIDCGVKHGIIRSLLRRGYHVIRVPWNTDPLDIPRVDGVVCSNGPGDPKACGETVQHVRRVLERNIPFLGICLGHQVLALALGADTYKLPYGHRGLNQPCMDVIDGGSFITSQNHGYAVDTKTIPNGFREWFVNLNDKTNEGLRHDEKKIMSVQFHPEGCPGPFDTEKIFDIFNEQ
jgi:carbamoyl-phosphate synthase small subunit